MNESTQERLFNEVANSIQKMSEVKLQKVVAFLAGMEAVGRNIATDPKKEGGGS